MRIAITGGAGFIGSHLTRAYLDAGHDVLVLDSLANGLHQPIDPRARFYQVDIRDEKLRTILQMERPEVVSHHAVLRQDHPGERALIDADIHVRGLLNVLESCVNASVRRFIFASGGHHLYGNTPREQLPLTENAPLCPHSAHDISKAAGEWYVRYYTQRYSLNHSILRYAEVYGETHNKKNPHIVSYFTQMLLQQQLRPVIRGSGQELRDYIFIDDVVQANLSILTRGENRTLHISSGQGHTLNRLYMLIAQHLKSRVEPIYLAGSPLDTVNIVLDNTQARLALGWQPRITVEEGTRRLVERLMPRTMVGGSCVEDEDDGPVTDKLLLNSEATLSRV
jgi:UDP-glucose 4-epimerase